MLLTAKYEIVFSNYLLFSSKQKNPELKKLRLDIGNFRIKFEFSIDHHQSRQEDDSFIYSSKIARILISRNEPSPPPNSNDKSRVKYFETITADYENVALNAIKKVIRFFKLQLNNPNLLEFSKYGPPYFNNTIWLDDQGNELNPGYFIHNSTGIDAFAFYRELNIKPYDEIKDSDNLQRFVANDDQRFLYQEILADARTAFCQENYRRAILEMAIACEIYTKKFYFGIQEKSFVLYDYLDSKKKIDLNVLELLHGCSKYIHGISFKEAYPKHYNNIDYLFRARNKIAHTGSICYRDNKGNEKSVDLYTMFDWWESLEETIQWLSSLSA